MTDQDLEVLLQNTGAAIRRRMERPYFATRVLAGLDASRSVQDDFGVAIGWAFRRVATAGLALAIVLLTWNAVVSSAARSPLDAVLAMPSVTLENAWELDRSELPITP